jgi:hypothetical protein
MQLDLLGGLIDKRNGMDRTVDHTDEWYQTQFLGQIESLPLGARYTSEDIRRHVGEPPGHPSVVGALMNAAYRLGYCEPTGDHTRARSRRSHAALLSIWRRC